MLYLLTGEIQTGKTRWLQTQIENLTSEGIPVYGVIAPGIWMDHGDRTKPRFEKLGINNVLLPSMEVVPFAKRRDLTNKSDTFSRGTQATAEKLGWAISDEALDHVNQHFATLLDTAFQDTHSPGWLIVDELGRLELLAGRGLNNAVKLLCQGPTPLAPNALVVVRHDLLPQAHDLLDASWTDVKEITPSASIDL